MKNIKPYNLYFQIGGLMGDFYRYQKVGQFLLYQKFQFLGIPESKITLPSRQKWQKFSSLLDDINVWEWQPQYKNPGIDDGIEWEFTATYKSKKLICKGDNNYPKLDGSPIDSYFMTEPFQRLVAAFNELSEKQETPQLSKKR